MAKKKVKPGIHKHLSKFVMYVIEGCMFCEKSIKMIKETDFNHKIIVVNTNKKDFYKKAHNMQSFPQIFYHTKNGTVIKVGGSDDLENLLTIIRNTNHTSKQIHNPK
jgi:glutaredoxin